MPTPLTITFLGTGTSGGVPMIGCDCWVCQSTDERDKRLRSSILVRSPQCILVVDATPDFRQQMLRQQVNNVDALLITHAHKDHVGGLDDTRALQYIQQAPTHIYANKLALEGIKREVPYAFSQNKYPGVPEFRLHEIGEKPITIKDITIQPFTVWHHQMPVAGFRFGNFTYITDANHIDEPVKTLIRGSEVLVLNALRKERHISHFTLDEACALSQEVEAQTTYLTHLSHQMGRHQEVEQTLAPNIRLAYDGLVIQVG